MALEYKSIDVNNEDEEKFIQVFQAFGWKLKSSQRVFHQSTTPTAAISYENYTYVHSETETVDFTKLVFERNKSIENYWELVELEQEFFDLNQEVAGGKPYIPPHATTAEAWARHFEPDLRTPSERKRLHTFFGILSGIFLLSAVIVSNTLENDSGYLAMMGLLFLCVLTIIVWRISAILSRSVALQSAIKNRSAKYRSRLDTQYQSLIRDLKEYEKNIDRMRDILREAESLL